MTFEHKYSRHIVVGIMLVILFSYSYSIYSVSEVPSSSVQAVQDDESFAVNVNDAIATSGSVASSKLLTDLYIEVGPEVEKESMCALISNNIFRADIFNVFFLLQCMKRMELIKPSKIDVYTITRLDNTSNIIRDLVNRFVYMDSTLDEVYTVKYGEGCVRNKDTKGTFDTDYRLYIDAQHKNGLLQIENPNDKEAFKTIKKILCTYYGGHYADSIKRVYYCLISISHFYTKRVDVPIPAKYKANLDDAIIHLYLMNKHVSDLISDINPSAINAIRKQYC